MKRAIVPIIFACLVLMGFGIMKANAYRYINKNESLDESTKYRELSLKEVRLTNITPQANVDYSIVYTIRKFRYTKGFWIRSKTDTLKTVVLARPSCRCKEGPKPILPKPLYWGKLDWR